MTHKTNCQTIKRSSKCLEIDNPLGLSYGQIRAHFLVALKTGDPKRSSSKFQPFFKVQKYCICTTSR